MAKKPESLQSCTWRSVARFFDVSVQTTSNWRLRGAPVNEDGSANILQINHWRRRRRSMVPVDPIDQSAIDGAIHQIMFADRMIAVLEGDIVEKLVDLDPLLRKRIAALSRAAVEWLVADETGFPVGFLLDLEPTEAETTVDG